MLKKLRQNQGLVFALFLLAVVSFLIYQGGLKISPEEIRLFVSQFGPLGPVAYIFLIVLSIIIAPISGLPIWIAGVFAFGVPLVVVYSWTAGNIGGALAFLIARMWGRPVVKRLVGDKAMSQVDKIAQEIGVLTLFILRVFQGTFFDVVSYGAGLTNITVRDYLIVTLAGTAITGTLFILLYQTLTIWGWSILGFIAIWSLIGYALASIPIIWYILKVKKRKKKKIVE